MITTELKTAAFDKNAPIILTEEEIKREKNKSDLWKKESKGDISFEEIQQLLEYEFLDYLEENEQIKQVFDPEEELNFILEIRKTKEFEPTEIKQQIKEFRNLYAKQRDAMATCRRFCLRIIDVKADAGLNFFLYWITKFAEKYGFSEKHVKIATELASTYVKNHKNVLELRNRHKNNAMLLFHLTGLSFTKQQAEKIVIQIGKGCFNLITDSFIANKIDERNINKSAPNNLGGFVSISKDGIKFNVIVRHDNKTYVEKLIDHETEHQFFDIFLPILNKEKRDSLFAKAKKINDLYFSENITLEQKNEYMRLYIEYVVKIVLNKVKDEFFASTKNNSSLSEIVSIFEQIGGPYDYLKNIREDKTMKDDEIFQLMVKEILIDKYRATIRKSFMAFFKLAKALEADLSRASYLLQEKNFTETLHGDAKKAIAMLTDIPLEDWPAFVRHQLIAMGLHSSQINNDVLQGSIIENRVQRFLLDSRSN